LPTAAMTGSSSEAPPPLGKLKALVFTSIGHFTNDGVTSFLPVIVDLLASLRGATPPEVLVLLSLFYFVSAVSSILVGMRADATGTPGALMSVGIACLGSGLAGFGLVLAFSAPADLFALALVCDLAMGVGSSFYHPLGGSILQSAFSHGETGRALGMNGALGSTGRAVYPSLFFLLAASLAYPGSLWLFGGVEVCFALIIWVGLRNAEVRRRGGDARRPSLRRALSKPMVILLVVAFTMEAAFAGVTSYTPIFLTTQRGFGIGTLLGAAVSAMYAPAIPGQPFFGFLADRLDRRVVVAISGVGAGGSILGYVLAGGIEGIALLVLFGFFSFTAFPLLLSLASNYTSEGSRSLGNSLIWGLGVTAGNSLGPAIVYALTGNDYARLGGSFEIMALLAVVSGLAALLIPKRRT
jgi:FSR family fosmidomycin resistance protein-like MFS transporter